MEYIAKEVCTELSTIIKYMPKEYQNKIPTNVVGFFEENKSNNYSVNINPNNIFDKSNIKKETLAIIAMLNIKYWCPNENLKKQLIKKYNVKSTVLQIPHHGSYTSSSEQFLKKVGAKYAVISCGKNNPYNHPRPEAMRRIKKYISNKNLYRTDQDGTILFINDGKKLIVKKE